MRGMDGSWSISRIQRTQHPTNQQTDTCDRVLFLTAGIVLLTILINGTTCKHLLNYLGASSL